MQISIYSSPAPNNRLVIAWQPKSFSRVGPDHGSVTQIDRVACEIDQDGVGGEDGGEVERARVLQRVAQALVGAHGDVEAGLLEDEQDGHAGEVDGADWDPVARQRFPRR